MEQKKYSKEGCILLLQEKQKALIEEKEERFPKRADFSEAEIVAIKAFLGPWPRALEAAGLKEEREKKQRIRRRKNNEKQ